jgi:hypothetical protein
MGVSNTVQLDSAPQTSFTSELNLGVKLFHVLGVEMSFSPTDRVDMDQALVLDATFRLSALIYIVPTYPMNLYLKGGLGAGAIGDLFDIDGSTTSYHAGAGLAWHVDDHLVLGAEFLLLLPGVNSIRGTIETFANDQLRRYQARARGETVEEPEQTVDLGDFLRVDNFRVALNARYYF